MPIVFSSKLNSTVANATFLDKTIDDETIGLLALNETLSGNSGDKVDNSQLEINKARKVVFAEQTKLAGGTITPDSLSMNQEFRLSGSGGAIVMNLLPFTGLKVVEDGTKIMVVGHDSTNTVEFTYNDVQFGLLLNGNATLELGFTIILNYNDELERYIEVGRNF
tara:strand:- start:1594 stop:2088 length:495 start_codon:yes stop_codon:yes gene_type:complete